MSLSLSCPSFEVGKSWQCFALLVLVVTWVSRWWWWCNMEVLALKLLNRWPDPLGSRNVFLVFTLQREPGCLPAGGGHCCNLASHGANFSQSLLGCAWLYFSKMWSFLRSSGLKTELRILGCRVPKDWSQLVEDDAKICGAGRRHSLKLYCRSEPGACSRGPPAGQEHLQGLGWLHRRGGETALLHGVGTRNKTNWEQGVTVVTQKVSNCYIYITIQSSNCSWSRQIYIPSKPCCALFPSSFLPAAINLDAFVDTNIPSFKEFY